MEEVGSNTGGSRDEDVELMFRRDKDGLDPGWIHQKVRSSCQYISRRMLRLRLPGRRPRGRPSRRFMEGIKEDMKLVGVTEKDAKYRARWRQMTLCGDT